MKAVLDLALPDEEGLAPTIPDADTAVADLWHRYRRAWLGTDIDLFDLYHEAVSLLAGIPTNAALRILVNGLRRDLDLTSDGICHP